MGNGTQFPTSASIPLSQTSTDYLLGNSRSEIEIRRPHSTPGDMVPWLTVRRTGSGEDLQATPMESMRIHQAFKRNWTSYPVGTTITFIKRGAPPWVEVTDSVTTPSV